MPKRVTIDGNEAAAYVAYKTNEVVAIYPITSASPMGELSEEWSARAEVNLWGSAPQIIEMQSEAYKTEPRFSILWRTHPDNANAFLKAEQQAVTKRFQHLKQLSELPVGDDEGGKSAAKAEKP